MTPEQCLDKRREFLASARTAEQSGNEALGAWHRLFAANMGLMASDDPAVRERGKAMLKRNSERFERDFLHPELGERLRAAHRGAG
jgi:hypothetical protein